MSNCGAWDTLDNHSLAQRFPAIKETTALQRSIIVLLLIGALIGSHSWSDQGDNPANRSLPKQNKERTPVAPGIASARSAPGGSWRQWGGPRGDFKVDVRGLAEMWPTEGPPVLWSRPLGIGYSAIAIDAGQLFTMYRDGDEDVVVVMRAADGSTLWEHRYPARANKGNLTQFGTGPHATPLVLDNRVITLGYTGVLNCLERKSGSVLWSHELIKEFGGAALEFGYSASPIVHDGRVIVLVGGERHGVVAFDPADGSVAWYGPPTSVSYATPIVIDVDGQLQLVYFSADEIIAVEPGSGKKLWRFPVVNQYRNNSTGPHWGNDNLLWVATQMDGGTRALRLERDAKGTQVEEVWVSNKLSVHFWNTLLLGDYVYASVGGNASVLVGVDLRSGEVTWRNRGFKRVNFVHAGERTILFDENGNLAMAELSPEGINILSQARILEGPTWTVPTLAGTRLYIRDKKTILALDLAPSESREVKP